LTILATKSAPDFRSAIASSQDQSCACAARSVHSAKKEAVVSGVCYSGFKIDPAGSRS
jgi:hypothetical protein